MEKKIFNYTEKVVDEVIEEYFEECPECKENLDENDLIDIKAYTLNLLEARYYTSTKGEILTTLNDQSVQNKAHVLSVVIQAVEKIKNDRHTKG